MGWQIYAITGSALDLGLVGLVQFLPMILLTLVVGRFADRYDRRAIVSCCQVLQAGAATLLALGSAGGWLGRESMLAIVAVVGAARAFEGPTMAALMPGLVPRLAISRAAAWAISATQTAQIVGPALGGLLYLAGPGAVYGAAAALFVLAGVCTATIRIAGALRDRAAVTLPPLFSGITFIAGTPILLGTLSLDLFAVLLGGDILATGPWGLGLLRSAPAVGALVMSFVLVRHPIQRRVGPRLFGAVLAFGAATVVFGLSTSLPLSFAALAVLGGADVVSMVIRSSLVQLRTPDAMRGRVSAVSSLFTGTSNQLGEFRAGLTAAYLGAVPAVLIGGLGSILVAGLWMYLFPALRGIRTLDG